VYKNDGTWEKPLAITSITDTATLKDIFGTSSTTTSTSYSTEYIKFTKSVYRNSNYGEGMYNFYIKTRKNGKDVYKYKEKVYLDEESFADYISLNYYIKS